jgi:hypothetical protein
MKFKARRGVYIKMLVAVFFIVPVLFVLFLPDTMLEKPAAVAILFVPFFLFLWIYVDTSYTIDDGKLFYKSAFLRGSIPISHIQKVVKGKTAWSGIRPATAFNGLLIVFDKADEVYISPENNDLLVWELLRHNEGIKVLG